MQHTDLNSVLAGSVTHKNTVVSQPAINVDVYLLCFAL